MTDRQKSDATLDALERGLPAMIERSLDECDFWDEFADVQDAIMSGLGDDDRNYASDRIEAILKAGGLSSDVESEAFRR